MSIKNIFSVLTFIIISFPFFLKAGNANPDAIIGKWMNSDKDLQVEVYKVNGIYYGKIIWFTVYGQGKTMKDFFDKNNADFKLRKRPWLGLQTLKGLRYTSENNWENGKIYDPKSGKTYSASVKLKSPNVLVVRGFIGIELLGKSLTFNRVK